MSRIKELAKEIFQTSFTHFGLTVYSAAMVDKLLERIASAEEHEACAGRGGGTVHLDRCGCFDDDISIGANKSCSKRNNGAKGHVLFFPDPQPTLREAAQAIIPKNYAENGTVTPKRWVEVPENLIDSLKSALEREE